jgi:hypothetical protein
MEIDPKEAMLKIYNPAQNSTQKNKQIDNWNSNPIDTKKAL